MNKEYDFSEQTKSAMLEMEEKIKKEERSLKIITREQLDFIDKLIERYDEVFGYLFDKRLYEEVCIYGQTYLILPDMAREIRAVVKAINTNSFDNHAVYKRYEENGEVKRRKTYKPYRIKRLAQMLRVAKEANYKLFESFVKIPDVYYALSVIKSNPFGELDVYMGAKRG